MKKNVLFVLMTLLVLTPTIMSIPTQSLASTDSDIEVSVWETNGEQTKLLQQEDSVSFQDDQGQANRPLTIEIDESVTYQEMEGFGAAVSGSTAHLFMQLSADERQEILMQLFGDRKGDARLSYIRVTMGSSDFNLERYTYNDLPEGEIDLNLEHFSVEKDADVIQVVQEILAINPEIKVLASPWSPPAWMKTPETLNGGQLNPEYYEVYSQYFVKFIQAYEESGIPITAVTVQNEPHHEAKDDGHEYGYPSMRMTAAAQTDFIKYHLGPLFHEKAIETEIIIWDHNWNESEYPLEVLADEEAKSYVAGTAFHCYAGEPHSQSLVHQAHPDKGIWFTECSGGGWATDFADNLAWNMENLIFGTTRNWSKSVLLWNLALDENSGPITPSENPDDTRPPAGCLDCRGVVTVKF